MIMALLDANVLYPAPMRDYLLHLAESRLYMPLWTDKIQEEWISNLLQNRPDLKKANLERTRRVMDTVFPAAKIENYDPLISGLILPDANDRHVLAAAIKANAGFIVTNNIKDFPAITLMAFNIKVVTADDFIEGIILENRHAASLAFDKQFMTLRKPPLSREDALQNLEACGLVKTVAMLKE